MPWQNDIDKLYLDPQRVPLETIPLLWPADHTMDSALDQYVTGKMPQQQLSEAIAQRKRVRVLGVFDPHFAAYCKRNSWLPKLIAVRGRISNKRFNYERPKLYEVTEPGGSQSIAFTVMPGWEYVRQYGWLVRQFIDKYQPNTATDLLEVTVFPVTNDTMPHWTGLTTDSGVSRGDVVILGYVDEYRNILLKYGFTEIDSFYDPSISIYGRSILKNNRGQRILLLGVIYSYWGSIVGRIADVLYDSGARELIYAAKCGTLADPADIYTKLVIPRYYALYTDGRFEFFPDVPNPLRDINRPQMTGLHVSVPSVVGETYDQREDLHRLGGTSIDNEISHIAAVAAKQVGSQHAVNFCSMHFSTDYVRRRRERGIPTSNDLSTGSTDAARRLKAERLAEIGGRLYSYLINYEAEHAGEREFLARTPSRLEFPADDINAPIRGAIAGWETIAKK